MKRVLSLLLIALASPASAQGGRQPRDAGTDARTDSMLGTPNKVTPVPQDNRFSTSPGLQQQAPGPQGTMPAPPATDKPR